MSLRLHEIAEANHRILNPFTEEKLMLLGEVCRLQVGQRQLDLACGKGEMLTRWAERYGTSGVGVDLSEVFLTAARARAAELGVSDRVTFVQAKRQHLPARVGRLRHRLVHRGDLDRWRRQRHGRSAAAGPARRRPNPDWRAVLDLRAIARGVGCAPGRCRRLYVTVQHC
jgi:SAM-dependent methyltransferase